MTAADPRDERPVAEAPEVRFERADVVPGVVVRWAIGLGLVSVVAGAVSVWLLVFLRGREEAGDPQRPALYFSAEPRQPQGVRLQSKPFLDLQTLREQENEVLHKYGWVDLMYHFGTENPGSGSSNEPGPSTSSCSPSQSGSSWAPRQSPSASALVRPQESSGTGRWAMPHMPLGSAASPCQAQRRAGPISVSPASFRLARDSTTTIMRTRVQPGWVCGGGRSTLAGRSCAGWRCCIW